MYEASATMSGEDATSNVQNKYEDELAAVRLIADERDRDIESQKELNAAYKEGQKILKDLNKVKPDGSKERKYDLDQAYKSGNSAEVTKLNDSNINKIKDIKEETSEYRDVFKKISLE